MAEIARTATEPVTLTWLQDGAPVTGASPTMRVRRASDGFATVYDWTALAFVDPATAVAPFVALAPTDPTYEPGVYWHAFEPQAATNATAPDIYRVTYYADATLDAPLGSAEVRVGTVDTIDALPATLASAHGAGAWTTGAVAGDAMTLTAGALTAVQAKVLDDATPFHGASIATIEAFGAPPSAATIATQVNTTLAGAHGAGSWLTASGFATAADVAASTAALEAYGQAHWVTADISSLATAASLAAVAVDATKARRALWNRRTLSSAGLFTLYADDAATALATATITDKDGAAITLQTGEAARSTALV